MRLSRGRRYSTSEGFTPPTQFENDQDTLALYAIEEGAGELLLDSSGNGNDGKIIGAKWVRVGGSSEPHTGATPWIDVISLIDPKRDPWEVPGLTGKNEWVVENGELTARCSDGKPCKLLFPVDLIGKSLEWDIEFTRTSGQSGFNVDIPSEQRTCPVMIDYTTPGRVSLIGAPPLAGACRIRTGERSSIRVLVEHDAGNDKIEVWFDGESLGVWNVRREDIGRPSNEKFPTGRRSGLWIPGGEFVFHEFRMRVLDGGKAVPLRAASSPPVATPPPAVAPFDAAAAKAHQEAWADFLGESVEMTNSLGMKFGLIPPGEFLMGSVKSSDSEATAEVFENEFPQHPVRITQPFYLGSHEVTVGQFRKFVQATNYQTEAETDGHGGRGLNLSNGKWETNPDWNWTTSGFMQTDEHPVVQISWNDAVAFCTWLSQKEGAEYRLPTEAEWEYACRAGTTTLYQHSDDPEGLSLVGNVADGTLKIKFDSWATINAEDGYAFTAPAGRFRSNQFGIHDMHGNVWEWCDDRYGSDYYTSAPLVDPQGLPEGPLRPNRGGCWFAASSAARSACRRGFPPDVRNNGMGFRVLCRTVLK